MVPLNEERASLPLGGCRPLLAALVRGGGQAGLQPPVPVIRMPSRTTYEVGSSKERKKCFLSLYTVLEKKMILSNVQIFILF